MRESLFIKRNLARWQKIQKEPAQDPDEMASEFTTLLDDLAYAKTFYSYSKVTRYINGMAGGIYQRIYKNRQEDRGRIRRFFALELPLLFRKHQGLFLFTTLFFIFFCVIAAFSAAHDDTFVRGILGDDYINMTERNISKGDPFGVYKKEDELWMFVYIAFNNIKIALFCFVSGILLCLGTLWVLVQNGVMLGAFQYYFFAKGLGVASVLVIWIHGTLEISAIILSGTAGMIMGSKILFPGTLSRVDALKKGAKDGLKVMVSVVPILLCAAFLEGFITRHTAMPMFMSISILTLSLSFIVGYFVLYPIYLHRRGYALRPDGSILTPAKKNL